MEMTGLSKRKSPKRPQRVKCRIKEVVICRGVIEGKESFVVFVNKRGGSVEYGDAFTDLGKAMRKAQMLARGAPVRKGDKYEAETLLRSLQC